MHFPCRSHDAVAVWRAFGLIATSELTQWVDGIKAPFDAIMNDVFIGFVFFQEEDVDEDYVEGILANLIYEVKLGIVIRCAVISVSRERTTIYAVSMFVALMWLL